MQNTTTKKSKNIMNMFSGKQILIPIAALLLLAVFNLIADPSFYKISMDVNSAGNHVLSGYLITILDYGSELAILAIGMTLVTAASGGQDISVGAAIAIAGSVILRRRNCYCGFRDLTSTLWNKFQTGQTSGSDHCSIFSSMRCIHVIRCI